MLLHGDGGSRADRRYRGSIDPHLPGRAGGEEPDLEADEARAEPVHGGEPELQHPQRHLDDRRLQPPRPARRLTGPVVLLVSVLALRLARLRLRGPDRDRLPVDPVPAPGPDHRPRHAGADRHPGPADGPEPAGPERVPELRRRRLLLPRQQGPDLGRHQDRSHLHDRRGCRRRHVDREAGLRPDRRPRRVEQSGSPRRCPISTATDLVRLQAERQDRHPRPQDR